MRLETFWSGMLNDFLTSRTDTATGASEEIRLGGIPLIFSTAPAAPRSASWFPRRMSRPSHGSTLRTRPGSGHRRRRSRRLSREEPATSGTDTRVNRPDVVRDGRHRRGGLGFEGIGHGEHAGRCHLDRDQAGVRCVHQRQADVVTGEQFAVSRLRLARTEVERMAAAEWDRRRGRPLNPPRQSSSSNRTRLRRRPGESPAGRVRTCCERRVPPGGHRRAASDDCDRRFRRHSEAPRR